jgi:hypothetical protein
MNDVGDRFIAVKGTYRKVGDITIFQVPSMEGRESRSWIFGEDIFIKRVVGCAGDTLSRGVCHRTHGHASVACRVT